MRNYRVLVEFHEVAIISGRDGSRVVKKPWRSIVVRASAIGHALELAKERLPGGYRYKVLDKSAVDHYDKLFGRTDDPSAQRVDQDWLIEGGET